MVRFGAEIILGESASRDPSGLTGNDLTVYRVAPALMRDNTPRPWLQLDERWEAGHCTQT